jgi:two-component system phosphate regulon sensor histidine kinase PhoR
MSSERSYPWFYFFKVIRVTLLIFLPTLFLILFFYRSSYKEGLVSQVNTQIKENLTNTKATVELGKIDWINWCKNLPQDNQARYSLVTKDGNILCDNMKKDSKKIQDLSEINTSFAQGFGSQLRDSELFGTQAIFASLKIQDNLALRKVVPISSLKNDMSRFDRVIFYRIVPIAALSYFLFIFFFYRMTLPLGRVFSKVEKYKANIPYGQVIKHFYDKNEWAVLEDALNEADQKLNDQVNQVRSENDKIAAILESIYDDIIAIDPFETVLFFNTNFKDNFMREKNVGEILPKLWHTFSDEKVLASFRSVLKDGQTVELKGMNFLSSRHPERYFDLTITSLRNVDGKISGALGVFYDVTEFKRIEQMRVDFVANVSHEIRTPLTSIKGFSQILQSQKSLIPQEMHVFLEKIGTNTERMISLFNDLLNLSVIESNNALKMEKLPISSLIDAIADNIQTNYSHKKVRFEKDLKLETINGDQRLMEQVLSNLIDNSCKYSGPHPSVKITSFKKEKLGYIIISDNGPGIPKEHLQRIFERFYRVDSSRESLRGTGLGLSIVKHIIAKHGGKVWAESLPEQGTTFIVELPLS